MAATTRTAAPQYVAHAGQRWYPTADGRWAPAGKSKGLDLQELAHFGPVTLVWENGDFDALPQGWDFATGTWGHEPPADADAEAAAEQEAAADRAVWYGLDR